MSFQYSNTHESDIALMLAARAHIGAQNAEVIMSPYIYKRQKDGTHIFNIGKTWQKLMIAARVLAAVENPQDILVVGERLYAQRGVIKCASFIGAKHCAGRWIPGTLTNHNTKKFLEPRVLVVADPRTDSQAIKESSYMNIPIIALCNTDAPLRHVDIAIPCNNRVTNSLAAMFWLLTREVLMLKGEIKRDSQWDILPDLFMYRKIDQTVNEEEQYDEEDEENDEGQFAAGAEDAGGEEVAAVQKHAQDSGEVWGQKQVAADDEDDQSGEKWAEGDTQDKYL